MPVLRPSGSRSNVGYDDDGTRYLHVVMPLDPTGWVRADYLDWAP